MNLSNSLFSSLPFLAYVFMALYALVVVILIAAVINDAQNRKLTNRGTFLVGPFVWGMIILLTGGFTGALAYWLIHYSSMRYVSSKSDPA